jgi:chromatin remodeling complex protein RSC6
MNALEKQIEEWFKSLHAAKGTLRTSKKEYLKELRANRAIQRGGKASASASSGAALSTEPKKASSFTKEVPISDALADFMGLPHGSTPKRNEAVTFVMNYMKQNGLTVGRKINPDAALKALLGDLRPNHTEFHYFNLQTYLSRHFGKAAINSGLISGQTASAPAATVA